MKLKSKKILLYLLTISEILVYNCFAGENIKLEPVIVTATRIYPEEEGKMPLRSEDSIVLGYDDTLSHFSVPAVLRDFSLTDVRTRGPFGVQSDISLRGAPFEENLVLLDGISINDPKSGHHNMDIPLTMHDVERVDVTYGSASSVYGSGALGGAVNIVPRRPDENLSIFGSSTTGSWDFYSGSASLNIPAGAIRSRNSVEWKRSTGYAPETEFDMLTASSFSEATFGCARFSCLLGYLTKKFGADSFYSNLFPDEEESVNTGILIAGAEIKKDTVIIKPVFYWKRLQDKFILDRNRRSFSRNDHTTGIYGGEVTSQVTTQFGNVAFGALVGNEKISSTNLNKHYRVKSGAFLEYENRIENLFLNAGARIDYYSTFKTHFSPSLNLGYAILPALRSRTRKQFGEEGPELTVRAGCASSFRVPTFTELYYSTAANKGNPDLEPEKAWNYETGLNYTSDNICASASVFLRNTEKIIDWTRRSPTSAWQAENIGEFDMYGVETAFKFHLPGGIPPGRWNFSFRYAFLESLDKKGIISKYVLEYLKHNLSANLECDLPFGFREEIDFAFRKRMGYEKYFLLDLATYKDVELAKGKMTFFLKLSNVFNTEYTEQGDIKMPGFGAFAGGSIRF